jgi:hypothetical protein
MLIRAGAIYNISYINWETNIPSPRIVFVLYSPGVGKMHCLQLSAKQLSMVERMKLINTIAKLSKVPAAQKWNGRILFNVFKRYCPMALRQCYRTLWMDKISTYSLINYGLNDPATMLEEEKAYGSKMLYMQVKNNIIKKTLDMYTLRGFKPLENQFAKPIQNQPTPGDKTTVLDPKVPIVNPGINIRPANPTPKPPINIRPANPTPQPSINIRPANIGGKNSGGKGGNTTPNSDIEY